MGYFDNEYDLQSAVGTPNAPMASSAPAAASGGHGMAAAGAASGFNPYLMGGSFLVNYLAAKQAAFDKKKQQEMDIAKGYGNDQEQALNSLNSSWKSALLR